MVHRIIGCFIMYLEPSRKLIAHLDMNSFFASVEQQANPTLRGRPLGVCAYLHRYGCIIAASIEAKQKGMKVGMTVDEAQKAVPGAVFVQNDPPKYRAVTSRVFTLLHELTDKVEHYSIDEAFLDLTGWYRDPAEAAWALTRVRARIQSEIGDWLRCSIGIAPTRFLAKTASDLKKPNGLTIIDRDNLDAILVRLDMEDVCGIARRTRRRMERLGIMSLLELKQHPIGNLMREFGVQGYFWWCRLNAVEHEDIVAAGTTLPKSVGHSYCVPSRVNQEGKVLPVLLRLVDRAGRRMRRLGLRAGAVSIVVGLKEGGQGGGLSVRLPEPADDSFTLLGTTARLLEELWDGAPVNFLAATLSELSTYDGQTRIDDGYASWRSSQDRRVRASRAADAIRDRYGETAITYGDMSRLADEAPDRIGFRKTAGVDIPMHEVI
jgi:DNA polymerase-4